MSGVARENPVHRNRDRVRNMRASHSLKMLMVCLLPQKISECVVLVDGPLGVADRGDVLDHNDVIRAFALGRLALGTGNGRLVEQAVRFDHVVYDAALASPRSWTEALYSGCDHHCYWDGCRTQ